MYYFFVRSKDVVVIPDSSMLAEIITFVGVFVFVGGLRFRRGSSFSYGGFRFRRGDFVFVGGFRLRGGSSFS